MRNRIKIFSAAILLFSSLAAMSQSRSPKTRIMALVRPHKDSVLLRWAPQKVGAWLQLNKDGYIVKRMTITTNGKMNPVPMYVTLTPKPIKPWPLAKWEAVFSEDKYGSIAAEAIYGKEFNITKEIRGAGPAKLIDMVNANEQRFSIALFSADQSFRVAKAMGLGFTDTTTKPNEKYLYQIFAAPSKKRASTDTATIVTSYAAFKALPKPKKVTAKPDKQGVLVSWPIKLFRGIFTYYQVERSEDGGKTFGGISEIPIINTQANDKTDLDIAFQLDSVSALNRTLIYRVKGVSPFGEVGPASDTISVTDFLHLNVSPSIKSIEAINGTAKINWSMPKSEAEVLGFDVLKSLDNDKGFVKINAERVSSTDSSFTDLKPENVTFYRVRAIGKSNTFTESYSSMIQMPDSIPPAPPIELKGEIDKKGIAKLKWKANTEKDLFGYRVFRANSVDGEYAQITRETRKQNNFVDTISLKTLTKYVFYKFVAIDKRYNASGFSEVLKIKRPDIIPPSAPVFSKVKSSTTAISLAWFNSVSEDVVKHDLLRTEAAKENWKVIASFTDTTKTYQDETVALNQKYIYKLRATDDSFLFSDSKAFSAQKINLGLMPDITIFKGTADRENQQIILTWIYKQAGVLNFLIYKAEENKPLRLFKTIDGKNKSFIDTELFINTAYEYRIKAVFAEGAETKFSDKIIVNY